MISDPYVIAGFAAAFIASLSWMMALTKLELSRAYPLMSISFVAVLLLSGCIFSEQITLAKGAGVTLIVAGVIVSTL
jgi:multidrug transporter EmrE-like cation transporter